MARTHCFAAHSFRNIFRLPRCRYIVQIVSSLPFLKSALRGCRQFSGHITPRHSIRKGVRSIYSPWERVSGANAVCLATLVPQTISQRKQMRPRKNRVTKGCPLGGLLLTFVHTKVPRRRPMPTTNRWRSTAAKRYGQKEKRHDFCRAVL